MDATDVVVRAQDALTVGRAVGEPIERDGVTVVPVARVSGGGGSGSGEGPAVDGEGDVPAGKGSGGGYGLGVVPAGAFVIRDGHVRWQPAVDVNRLLAGIQVVLVAALIVAWARVRSTGRTGGPAHPRRRGARRPAEPA